MCPDMTDMARTAMSALPVQIQAELMAEMLCAITGPEAQILLMLAREEIDNRIVALSSTVEAEASIRAAKAWGRASVIEGAADA